LYVLLIVLGLVLILWLWRRWRTSQESQPSPASTRNSASSAKPGRAPATAGTWPESEEQVFDRTGQPAEPGTMSSQPLEPAPITGKPVEQVSVAGAMAGTAAKRPIAAGPAGQPGSGSERAATELISVGTFQAVYQLGEPDYDEAFDVTDPKSGHVGQCGLALTDPIGRGHDQAAALQVWLWDTNDPNTKVKVLMSEGAYRDTALRDQLAGEQQAIPVRLGTEFDLESYNLLLRGKVDRLEYAQQEPAYGIFAELLVRLEVYRKI
jgi:hypothetical protein